MIYALLIILHVCFIAFFVSIGSRYLSIIPVGFILFFIFNTTTDLWQAGELHSFLEHDMYYLSRSFVILALYFLLVNMGMPLIYVGLSLIIFNILLYIGSLLTRYTEGITMFHLGRYSAWFLYIGHISIYYGPIVAWKITCMLCVFHMAVYGFIQFVIGSFVSIPKHNGYLIFLYAQATVLILLGSVKSEHSMLNLIAGQIYLMGNYGLIYTILRYYHYYQTYHTVDLKYILSGNKLFDLPTTIRSDHLDQVYRFFTHLTPTIKYAFGGLNLVIIVCIILMFVRYYRQPSMGSIVMYRLALGLFFVNYTLLKQIHYQSQLERIGVFVVLNVGALLGISTMFDGVVIQVMIAIIWNMLSSIAIFHIKQEYPDTLMPRDYWYRFRSNTLSVPFVLAWIVMLPINPTVRFSLILFYVCLYIFVGLQIYKFLKQH